MCSTENAHSVHSVRFVPRRTPSALSSLFSLRKLFFSFDHRVAQLLIRSVLSSLALPRFLYHVDSINETCVLFRVIIQFVLVANKLSRRFVGSEIQLARFDVRQTLTKSSEANQRERTRRRVKEREQKQKRKKRKQKRKDERLCIVSCSSKKAYRST